MSRGWVTGIAVGALVLLTATLALVALRPSSSRSNGSSVPDMGAIAVVGSRAWRWDGPSQCNPDTDIIPLQRTIDNGKTWQALPIPLVTVDTLQFRSENTGIAIGTTTQCSRGIMLTQNGGATWRSRDDNPVLLDAWWAGSRLWGIERSVGMPQLVAYTMRSNYKLVPVKGIGQVVTTESAPPPSGSPSASETTGSSSPCDAGDGTPTHDAFYTEKLGLLLCEQGVTGSRLVARTASSGKTFERLTDSRPDTGLDGPGPILDLDVAGKSTAWVQFAPHECAEGSLRRSETQGQYWERLPCPSRSAAIDRVLDAAFRTPNNGVMLGVKDGAVTLLMTRDGGSTWRPWR